MDPVARVVIETFLDDIFLDDDENTFEETLLLPARDADMDRAEAIIIIIISARECNKKRSCVVLSAILRATSRARVMRTWRRRMSEDDDEKEGNTK